MFYYFVIVDQPSKLNFGLLSEVYKRNFGITKSSTYILFEYKPLNF